MTTIHRHAYRPLGLAHRLAVVAAALTASLSTLAAVVLLFDQAGDTAVRGPALTADDRGVAACAADDRRSVDHARCAAGSELPALPDDPRID